ncbi:Cytosine/adenosine deaminase [Amycolatopsis pretoriensis]|uniref:Cytosine/adenosine deaminase n=1 Tax=Amycolatopsis pretoriensis TaxID=218821 RepID=A0A1H5QCC4_9PSEU|nr:amidohydrolase family protein [Amycolatopsis pretoriensis]SEF23762.1 Cytosine/adenosine deaminase [Amycolatopsis pretoriensis]
MTDSLIIRGARVLTMAPGRTAPERADILVEAGRIAAIGPDLVTTAPELDGAGCLALPGFADTHRHMWQAALRGSAPHHTLAEYFATVLERVGPALTPDDLYLGNLLSAYAALDAGITTVRDISNIQDSPAATDALVQALTDSGIRAVFAYGNSYPRAKSHGAALDDDVRRVRAELLSDDDALVTLALVTEPGDEDAERHNARLADDLGVRTARHVVHRRHGEGPISRLRALGVLRPGTTFIHGTGLDDGELRLIAESGGSLSIAPAVEMLMGHGYPPFTAAARAGVPVSLSTDVEVTAAADMFTQMRAAYQAARYGELSAGEPVTSVRDVLRAATDGATLAPGRPADVVLLRADGIGVAPVFDACSTVTLQMDRAHVDTVLVAGRVVKRHGRLFADVGEHLAAAERLRERLVSAG